MEDNALIKQIQRLNDTMSCMRSDVSQLVHVLGQKPNKAMQILSGIATGVTAGSIISLIIQLIEFLGGKK
jgi:chorismate synthase